MIANIQRQPKDSIRKVRSGADIAVPRVEEQFHTPVAPPRPRTLNQSRVIRAQVGKVGDSPMPSSRRAQKNVAKPLTMEPSSCASDQSERLTVSISRGPRRSTKAPAGN